jgi:hypothetical protein
MTHLTCEKLHNCIVGKKIVRCSTNDCNRHYVTYYNSDYTFIKYTYQKAELCGTTDGTWKIINVNGKGCLKLFYENIFSSESSLNNPNSLYCPHNPKSIYHVRTLTFSSYSIVYENEVCSKITYDSPVIGGTNCATVYNN